MDIRRFNVVMADFGETVGSEQGGLRPAVVTQNDVGNVHSPTTIVMPLTSKIKVPKQPTHTLIKKGKDNGLLKDSVVLGEQMRVISTERIKWVIGSIDNEEDRLEIRRIYNANFGE